MKRFQFQIILEFDFYKNQGSLANHMTLSRGKRAPWRIEIENEENYIILEKLDHCKKIYAVSDQVTR